MINDNVLLTTEFKELKLYRRGKVRDVYDLGDKLLIVSTDRISCFDVVLPVGIPYKGAVLTALSCFWFDFLKDTLRSHFITANTDEFPVELKKYNALLAGRAMLVKKTKPLPVECIVRGYLSGSGWKEYQNRRSICGIKLPAGLKESVKLAKPIFTPSTKANSGHDQNVTLGYIEKLIGKERTAKISRVSLEIYQKALDYALTCGIIIADTKLEFGIDKDEVILIDEALTPDSSRFWPLEQYAAGKSIPSFDKQFVRDYLETLDWDKSPPAPTLPPEIIEKTSQKYLQVCRKLTGRELKN